MSDQPEVEAGGVVMWKEMARKFFQMAAYCAWFATRTMLAKVHLGGK